MRFGFADPPYIGQAKKHYSADPNCAEVDHGALIRRLVEEFPDGWALSMSTPSLFQIVPLLLANVHDCESTVRIASWVKPFASFKPNVNPAYAWEPVAFRGGRKRDRKAPTARDWVSANITLKRGLSGAKPRRFCLWLFDLLGAEKGDELVDIYPGSGAVMAAWGEIQRGPQPPLSLALDEP